MHSKVLSLALLLTAGSSAAIRRGGATPKPKQAAAKSPGLASRFSGKVVPTAAAGVAAADIVEENGLQQLALDVSVTALRLGTCALMVHHGIDKLEHVDGFSANVVAKFFGFLPGDHAHTHT